jgi:hypothetical protein
MLRTSCCWLTNGMRYVLTELGSLPSVPEFRLKANQLNRQYLVITLAALGTL